MRVDILTTQQRDTKQAEQFWNMWGFTTQLWDNTNQPPGTGRNRILKSFYESDREWLIMVDDDCVISTERGDGREFLIQLPNILARLNNEITSFGIMNNIMHRVKLTLDNPAVQNNWMFMRNYWIGNIVFHRKGPNEYYQHPTDILEDQDWCLYQLVDNQRIAILMNVVLKPLSGLAYRSLLFPTHKVRKERYLKARQRLLKEWPEITHKNVNVSKAAMVNKHWPVSPQWHSVKGLGICYELSKKNTPNG